ncbi:MAG: hypothetical protein ACXVCY_02005 [Pseudobdellovibrionaceae bacterium]
MSSVQATAAPTTKTKLETKPFQDEPLLESVEPAFQKKEPLFLLNISLGFGSGKLLEQDKTMQGSYIAVRYMPTHQPLPDLDYQVDVNTENLIGFGIGKRWYCCSDNELAPYARLSGNVFLSSAGEIGSLVEIRRWRARTSLGLGKKISFEAGVGMAVTGADYFAQLGYNFEF